VVTLSQIATFLSYDDHKDPLAGLKVEPLLGVKEISHAFGILIVIE
jgi:hypothetical protein